MTRLTRIHIRIAGLQEDDDVATMHGAIAHEGRPMCGRRQIGAVDQYVIAYEKSVLHRAGGNDEVLEDESEDEEADDDNGAVRRQSFERALVPRVDWRGVGGQGRRIRCRLGHQGLLYPLSGRRAGCGPTARSRSVDPQRCCRVYHPAAVRYRWPRARARKSR